MAGHVGDFRDSGHPSERDARARGEAKVVENLPQPISGRRPGARGGREKKTANCPELKETPGPAPAKGESVAKGPPTGRRPGTRGTAASVTLAIARNIRSVPVDGERGRGVGFALVGQLFRCDPQGLTSLCRNLGCVPSGHRPEDLCVDQAAIRNGGEQVPRGSPTTAVKRVFGPIAFLAWSSPPFRAWRF